jgi:hypothetical protein
MSAAADSDPRVGTPGEERPLYGLPDDVECLRSRVPWQRTVQSSTGPTPQGTMTIESTEAGLDHRRDAQSVRVVTVIPAGSLSPDALFDREQASVPRRRGSVRVPGTPVDFVIPVDGLPVDFAGYEIPGLLVMMAGRSDHAIGIIAQNWPIAALRLVRITNLAPYQF